MAQASIQYTCRLLRGYGINNLTPEVIRQAKFDAPAVYQALLKAVHDLALCVAAGLPCGCGEGLSVLNQQLQHELVDAQSTSQEGRVLLLHLLSSWGCPPGLLAKLALGCLNPASCDIPGSSRICLLALAWLIGHAQLFDRALQHLQLPAQLLHLLPPYPADTTSTASAQAAFSTAVTRAQQHSCTVQQLLQSQPPAADGSCWPAVQAAAQHLLSSYRAACLRLQQLTSLLAGREKLLHQVQLEQQQEPGQQHVVGSHSSKSSSSSSSSLRQPIAAAAGGLQRQPLTAFELHLIRNPVLLQQHEQALHKACGLLQQQLQCIQAAQTFFAWAGSVLQEEQKAAAAAQPPPPPAGSSITTSKTYCQQHHATISTPSVADVLPLLRQLPDVATPAAETVLERIVKQLRQAVVDGAAAGVACLSSHTAAAGRNNSSYSSGTSRSFDRGSSSSMDKNQAAADVVKEQLAKLSVTPAAGAAAELHCDSAAAEQLLQPYWQVAATAMLDQGFVLGCSEKLSALPSDLKEQLQKGGCAQQPEEQQRQQPARAWHQLSLSQDQMSALHARFHHLQQLQQNPPGQPSPPSAGPTQRTAATATATATRNPGHAEEDVGNAAVSLADARLLQDVRVREGQAELVPVASEVLRLQELSLLVAKQLAEKRAVNKKQLQALQDAILCAAGSEQLLVLK